MRKSLVVASVAVAAIGLSGLGVGIASAAIPDSSGVIHGCYKPNANGSLSVLGVVDTALSGGHCPGGQTALTWNQTGPAGATGPQGPVGATGVQGPQGPAGISDLKVETFTGLPSSGATVVSCPADYSAIGGGATEQWAGSPVPMFENGPTADGTGWQVAWVNEFSQPGTITSVTVTATCVPTSGISS